VNWKEWAFAAVYMAAVYVLVSWATYTLTGAAYGQVSWSNGWQEMMVDWFGSP